MQLVFEVNIALLHLTISASFLKVMAVTVRRGITSGSTEIVAVGQLERRECDVNVLKGGSISVLAC